MAWADTELFHLGPVVAAQQVHHQPKNEEMCKYVYMYIACIFVYNTKNNNNKILKNINKKMWLASFGKFISFGTELNPLCLLSEQVWEKRGGGGNLGRLPGNRLVSADLDFWGSSDPRSTGPSQFCFVYEFNWVPSTLHAYQPVVIQQLSIG